MRSIVIATTLAAFVIKGVQAGVGLDTESDTTPRLDEFERVWRSASWVNVADSESYGDIIYTKNKRMVGVGGKVRSCTRSDVLEKGAMSEWYTLNEGPAGILDRHQPQVLVILQEGRFVQGDETMMAKWERSCIGDGKLPPKAVVVPPAKAEKDA